MKPRLGASVVHQEPQYICWQVLNGTPQSPMVLLQVVRSSGLWD